MRTLITILLLTSCLWAKEPNAMLTAYCSCESCCSWHVGKDGKPKFNLRPGVTKIVGQTASGKMAKATSTLAAPKGIPFGTKIYATMNGESVLMGIVDDRGGAIHADDGTIRIDIYFDTHQEARNFGRRKVFINKIELPDMDSSKIIKKL